MCNAYIYIYSTICLLTDVLIGKCYNEILNLSNNITYFRWYYKSITKKIKWSSIYIIISPSLHTFDYKYKNQ